jgi:hypothetical protein
MILSIVLPRVGEQMHRGTIHRVVAQAGEAVRPGTPLLEVRVDIGAATQDCPPLFFFRLIATERAFLRSLTVATGDVLDVGTALGVATSTADESFADKPARALRTTSVAIQVDPLSRLRA